MKKILITGAGSYIGTSFEKYIQNCKFEGEYQVDTLDMINPSWKEYDFSGYDTVFHVAGIAHRKETKTNAYLYYEVNRDLAVATAIKSKEQGVSQFVFMSSMSVYGLVYSKEDITRNTCTLPTSNYGKSKLEAEKLISAMQTDTFKVAILRPPMVYGENSPGNLTKLFSLVRKVHLFPEFYNQRSSISVDNLCEFVCGVIDDEKAGLFFPQNESYMCTYEIVRSQMIKENVPVIYIKIFNPVIRLLIGKLNVFSKIFGDLKYER